MKKLRYLDSVIILWRDSKIYYGQTNNDEEYDCEDMQTVGFWLGWRNRAAIVARDLVGDEERGVIAIPKENIILIKNL